MHLPLEGNSLTGFIEVPLTRSYKYLGTIVVDIPSIHLEVVHRCAVTRKALFHLRSLSFIPAPFPGASR
eukprot:546785-Prorocentrum_lima.AAC.1